MKTSFFLGGRENDTFFGGSGTDQLVGLAGNDELRGNGGFDALTGGAGDDDLFGGASSDVFFFDGTDDDDTIHDFELGSDTMFFIGTAITSKSQLSFQTFDADGDSQIDDAFVSYQVGGVFSSITVLNVDGQTLATTDSAFNVL